MVKMNTLELGSECRWEALTSVLVGDLTMRDLVGGAIGRIWILVNC